MGKYLHLFENSSDFREDYYDEYEEITTAFTTSSGTFVFADKKIIEFLGDAAGEYFWVCDDLGWSAQTDSQLINIGEQFRVDRQGGGGQVLYVTVTEVSNVPNTPKYVVPWVSCTEKTYASSFKATIDGPNSIEGDFVYIEDVDVIDRGTNIGQFPLWKVTVQREGQTIERYCATMSKEIEEGCVALGVEKNAQDEWEISAHFSLTGIDILDSESKRAIDYNKVQRKYIVVDLEQTVEYDGGGDTTAWPIIDTDLTNDELDAMAQRLLGAIQLDTCLITLNNYSGPNTDSRTFKYPYTKKVEATDFGYGTNRYNTVVVVDADGVYCLNILNNSPI